MSTLLPTAERSSCAMAPAVIPPPAQTSRPQRVLACVLCQQRKVKCDRKFPCANCIRSRTQCVPATLATRRRRRKFPERELLERLHRYEDLLRQNNVKFSPLFKESTGEKGLLNAEGGYDSEDEHPEAAEAGWPSPATTAKSDRVYEAKYAFL
jgi:Fungal Zn(2)-Cys(6) binuclear cluster domain